MSPHRERYRVDLPGLQATCEANYWRLMRLMPEMRTQSEARRLNLTLGTEATATLIIRVVEHSPYTSLLHMVQESGLSWLPTPHLEVRAYHDARMAEVTAAQNLRRFRSLYPYPNPQMHQPDEKFQLNLFLGEWLSHCFSCGYEPVPVI